MPTLIQETGLPVANANSYATLAEIRAYALDRGITLASDDNIVAANAILAMDYIASFSKEFKGLPTFTTQELDWPRTGVIINELLYPIDSIPKELRFAQSAAVIQIHKGVDLLPVSQGAQIRAERIGALSVEYFSQRGLSVLAIPAIDNLLAPLLENTATLTSRRI